MQKITCGTTGHTFPGVCANEARESHQVAHQKDKLLKPGYYIRNVSSCGIKHGRRGESPKQAEHVPSHESKGSKIYFGHEHNVCREQSLVADESMEALTINSGYQFVKTLSRRSSISTKLRNGRMGEQGHHPQAGTHGEDQWRRYSSWKPRKTDQGLCSRPFASCIHPRTHVGGCDSSKGSASPESDFFG